MIKGEIAMECNKETSKSKLSRSIKIIVGIFAFIASVCTVFGVDALGLLSPLFDNTTSVTPIIKDHYFNKEQRIVDYYVPLCEVKIIPSEEWIQYSEKELYYIRNGIYAYEGMKFAGNFYSVFEWYVGKIEQKDFEDGSLNYYQNKNITNIMEIEKNKRKRSKKRD